MEPTKHEKGPDDSGVYACLPLRRLRQIEAEIAEDIREIGREPSVAHAPGGTAKRATIAG